MHRHLMDQNRPSRIAFVPDQTRWTAVPSDWTSLSSQRVRWQRGLFQVLLQNRGMLFRPRYGWLGSVLLPYLWIFELLEPIIEVSGYVSMSVAVAMGIVGWHVLVFWVVIGLG